uniref:(northern house mosquito) hypothetical protein n=1 Tax=Culex pipiens TaxID=7175 RepID=A0A8D8GWM7_CULPI
MLWSASVEVGTLSRTIWISTIRADARLSIVLRLPQDLLRRLTIWATELNCTKLKCCMIDHQHQRGRPTVTERRQIVLEAQPYHHRHELEVVAEVLALIVELTVTSNQLLTIEAIWLRQVWHVDPCRLVLAKLS